MLLMVAELINAGLAIQRNQKMTINIKLTKISTNVNKLRTNEISGCCHELPRVGFSFHMYSEGIEFGTRCVSTSTIKEINEETKTFKTLNSEYKIEVLDKVD